MTFLYQFGAEAATPSGGLSMLGINLQGFIFQLITFVLVLLLLNKFVYKRLVETLEARRKAVISSLDDAKKAAVALEKTNKNTAVLMEKAKQEAADIVALAHTEARSIVDEAEEKAGKKADHAIKQAEARIASDIADARKSLRREMATLVADATEMIVGEKLDAKKDAALIERALEAQKQ